jgi:hydroxymethylbilane synthase
MDSSKNVTIGSRESQLAMVQTHFVRDSLQKHHSNVNYSILGMTTTGDQVLDVALNKVGTKSLFTKELEVALIEKTVDLVVHSLKDLPTILPDGLKIGAILEREDPRDAVVMSLKNQGKNLEDLLPGSVIGTSSVRRTAQLKRQFPNLVFKDVVS